LEEQKEMLERNWAVPLADEGNEMVGVREPVVLLDLALGYEEEEEAEDDSRLECRVGECDLHPVGVRLGVAEDGAVVSRCPKLGAHLAPKSM
jgi:hypothetical protein